MGEGGAWTSGKGVAVSGQAESELAVVGKAFIRNLRASGVQRRSVRQPIRVCSDAVSGGATSMNTPNLLFNSMRRKEGRADGGSRLTLRRRWLPTRTEVSSTNPGTKR